MANFLELNENLNKILMKLITNDNLTKLLYYDSPNALLLGSLESPDDLLYTKIFPYPTNTNALKLGSTPIITKASSVLIVGFDNFKANGNTFVGNILYFRILSHQSLQRLNQDSRVYMAMHEIAQMFNNQKIIGLGKVLFSGGGEIREDEYLGYELIYRITDFS